jgi:hypothetical protein
MMMIYDDDDDDIDDDGDDDDDDEEYTHHMYKCNKSHDPHHININIRTSIPTHSLT